MLKSIPISSILPGPECRLRQINEDKVQALVKSIQEIGLQSPISLRAHPTIQAMPGCHEGNVYYVVAGEHRLQACRVLGWKEIPAFILDLDELHCQLWEIDENLVRAELTELERAEHIRVRKVVYEQMYPETRNGGDHGNQYTGGKKRQNPNSGFCQPPKCFVDDTAEKTGMSRAAVAQSVQRAEAIAPEVKKAIADMPEIADKGVELDALAAVTDEEQKAAVEAVKSGKAKNIREATKGAKPRKPRKCKPKPVPTNVEVMRKKIARAVKRFEKATGGRVADTKVTFHRGAIHVTVTFGEEGTTNAANDSN